MAEFEDVAGGVLSGAGAGAFAGPIGMGVGGAIGGLYGLFGKKKKPLIYDNGIGGQITSQAYGLMSSHLGADAAGQAARQTGRNQQLAQEGFENTPGMGNNAAVRQAFTSNVASSAADQTIAAQLKGAEFDQQSKLQGINLLAGQQAFGSAQFEKDQDRLNRPNFFESMLKTGIAQGIGGLMAPKAPDTSTTSPDGASPSTSGGYDWNSAYSGAFPQAQNPNNPFAQPSPQGSSSSGYNWSGNPDQWNIDPYAKFRTH